jgi:hypothetical protein
VEEFLRDSKNRRIEAPSMPDRPHRRLRFERLEPRAMLAAVPVGAEFRVNTFTVLDQERPSAAMDADGDFVVVWMSEQDGGSGTPGSYSGAYGIYAQRYNTAGVPQGSEFRVNTHTTGPQMDPIVAMDADGDFVVVWWGEGAGDTGGVFAQRYNASGVAQGSEFRVNMLTTLAQFYPSVAMDADGDFVVAFSTDIFPAAIGTMSTRSATTRPASLKAASSASTRVRRTVNTNLSWRWMPTAISWSRGRAIRRTAAVRASTPIATVRPARLRGWNFASTPTPPQVKAAMLRSTWIPRAIL